MFSLVVLAVAIGVVTMYVRHELHLRRKRRGELTAGDDSTPPPPGHDPR
ncbi:MAG TPA: hypothetical protein VFK02_05625 [Kofleriaceae bacterium]|nr:hypothetical protein [Kofleriaceae bacterium]